MNHKLIFTAIAFLSLFAARAVDIEIEELPDLKPSQAQKALITIGVIESLFLTKHVNATDCKHALEDSIDQSYYFTQNRTIGTNENTMSFLDPYLNFTALVSDSATRVVQFCPVAV